MIFPNWAPQSGNGASNFSEFFGYTTGTKRASFDSSAFATDESHGLIIHELPDLSNLKVNDPVIGYKLPREFTDTSGEFITAVYTLKGDGDVFINPHLTRDESGHYTVQYVESEYAGLWIDSQAWDLFLLGYVTIAWLPSPSTIKTNDAIECDTVISKNSLSLRETPIPIFQRPVNYGEDDTTWWMSWGYNVNSPEFAELLEGQPFIFEDRLFGLSYKLYKSANEWVGSNVCISIQSETSLYTEGGTGTLHFYVRRSDVNIGILQLLGLSTDNVAMSLTPYIKMTSNRGATVQYTINWSIMSKNVPPGCDGVICEVSPEGLDNGDIVTVDVVVNGQSLGNLSFEVSLSFNKQIVYPHHILDTIDTIGFFNNSTIEPTDELKIYMLKAFTVKSDNNNWDGVTNPFVYINNVDGYNITPDPSSSTALIAPYSIVSNGVMLAENLESHTFKINDIGNDLLMLTSRLNMLTAEVQELNAAVIGVETKTSDMDYNKLIEIFEFFAGIVFKVKSITNDSPLTIKHDGISNVPALSFTDNRVISSVAIDSEAKNDNSSIPTTKWVMNQLNSATGNGSVRFAENIVGGNWKSINDFIHGNLKENEVLIFQTSYDKVLPLCVVVFPCVIFHLNVKRRQSTAIASRANNQTGEFFVATITGTADTMVSSITWSRVALNPVADSTSNY